MPPRTEEVVRDEDLYVTEGDIFTEVIPYYGRVPLGKNPDSLFYAWPCSILYAISDSRR